MSLHVTSGSSVTSGKSSDGSPPSVSDLEGKSASAKGHDADSYQTSKYDKYLAAFEELGHSVRHSRFSAPRPPMNTLRQCFNSTITDVIHFTPC